MAAVTGQRCIICYRPVADDASIEHASTCVEYRRGDGKAVATARDRAEAQRTERDLQRERARSIVEKVSAEGINPATAKAVALLVLDSGVDLWRDSATALEGSTARGAKGRKDEFRVAARLATTLSSLVAEADIGEPAPAAAPAAPAGRPPESIENDVTAYLMGETELPPVDQPEESAVQSPFVFADPDPQLPAESPAVSEAMAALAIPGIPDDVAAEAVATIAGAGSPFADPRSSRSGRPTYGRVVEYSDLLAAPDLPAPGHRSYSQLDTYAGCGLKYRLQRRTAGIVQRPSWALIGGTAVHDAIERIERGFAKGSHPSPADVMMIDDLWNRCLHDQVAEQSMKTPGVPMDDWHAAARGAEGYTWWMVQGVEMLRGYLAWRFENWEGLSVLRVPPRGAPVIELDFHIDVADVPVVGKIDIAFKRESTGEVLIVDLKSGKRTPSDHLQLKTYAAALTHLGVDHTGMTGAYFMLRQGKLSDVGPLTYQSWPELTYRYASFDRAEASGVHLAQPSSFCSACSVAHACPAFRA